MLEFEITSQLSNKLTYWEHTEGILLKVLHVYLHSYTESCQAHRNTHQYLIGSCPP